MSYLATRLGSRDAQPIGAGRLCRRSSALAQTPRLVPREEELGAVEPSIARVKFATKDLVETKCAPSLTEVERQR